MPKKKIIIDGEIGWDVYASGIRKQFEEAEGQEVEIELSSPGGFISEGLTISNIIRKYNDEIAKVEIIMMGLAASMASYIMMSVPKNQRKAYDDAIFMIHNPWSFQVGDYRDMQNEAEFLISITNHVAKKYSDNTKNSHDKIRELMDTESWYYGEEMKDAGFIGKIITNNTENKSSNKSESVNLAKLKVESLFSKMQKSEKAKKDIERAVALLPKTAIETPQIKLSIEGAEKLAKLIDTIDDEQKTKPNTEVKRMTLQELLAQNPEAKLEFENLIITAKGDGEKKVQDRIDAVVPFLNNDAYKGIETLVSEVLSNKSDISALKAAIASFDMMKQQNKSSAAQEDTDDNPDTPPLKGKLPKENGEVESEEDFQAEIARKKGGK